MNEFSLSRPPETVLKRHVESEMGATYPIDPSFRTVLACLRVLTDPDKDPMTKALYLAQRFFIGNPPPDMDVLFARFVAGDDPGEERDEPVMDFETDAAAIYASFRQQYGLDLLRTDLHWAEFRALLGGLGEGTAFGQRVSIRAMDDSDLDQKSRAKLRKLKDMVAIVPKMGQREKELREELARRLDAGEDPVDIINELKEV